MSKLSLSKNLQKKKAQGNVLTGQRLLSSFFPVASKKNTVKEENQHKEQENEGDLRDLDVKINEKNLDEAKQRNPNLINVLRDLPIFSPSKKLYEGLSENTEIIVKSPIKVKPATYDSQSSVSEFSSPNCSPPDGEDSPSSLKRKRDVGNVLENDNDDMSLSLAQLCRCKVLAVHTQGEEKIISLASCANEEERADCTLLATWTGEVHAGVKAMVLAIWSECKQRWEVGDNCGVLEIWSEEMDQDTDDDLLANMSDLDFLDFDIDEAQSLLSLEQLCRCKVLSLQTNGRETVLQLASCSNKNQQATCTLLDSWVSESDLQVGEVVSIRALWSEDRQRWEVGDQAGLLVEHPDLLLGCTAIMTGLRCRRSAVLAENFRGIEWQDKKGYLTLGSLLHELTQECMAKGIVLQEDVVVQFDALLKRPRVIRDLYALGHKRSDVETWADTYMSSIAKFLERYANPNGSPLPPNQKLGPDQWPGVISEIVDIEDTVWLPRLGLKGKLDLTCRTTTYPNIVSEELPVELKTGKTSDNVAHRGQVMLYNTMLSELEHRPVNTGLVVYLKDNTVHEVHPNLGEKRDSMIMRNQLARHLTNRPTVLQVEGKLKKLVAPQLPPPITRPKECGFCSYLNVCTSYLSQEEWTNEKKGMPQRELMENPDCPQSHRDWFVHWTCLVQMEKQGNNPMAKLWLSSPAEREAKKLQCVAGLQVIEVRQEQDRFEVVFQRSPTTNEHLSDNGFANEVAAKTSRALPLTEAGFQLGDLLVVGNKQRLNIVLAYVVSATPDSLTLSMDKDVTQRFGHAGYNLDLYESTRITVSFLSALAQLMAVSPEATKLRQIVIDGLPPVFTPDDDKVLEKARRLLPSVFANLNPDQTAAVKKVLEARSFMLIRGLPGTGKTSTIVAVVRVLVALGRSVLITSHTNSAVDNVLGRLLTFNVPLVRLGSASRATPALAPHCEESLLENLCDTEQFEQRFMSKMVVGVTCASSSHTLLRRRRFDYCIVDEATQVTQPSVLPALLSADVFVLVGDPDQLQPVVTNTTASELGMKQSMFERLSLTAGSTTVLGLQYRMNQALCSMANHLTYGGSLQCGNRRVASAAFTMPNPVVGLEGWLAEALSPLPERSLVFLDTGVLPAEQGKQEDGTNLREAAVLIRVLSALRKGGLEPSQVGVMSPFRAQANYLRTLTLREHGVELEVSTVDQFQGKDKYVTLISCGRSFHQAAETPERAGILNDLKRLTVAMTRARVKIVLVGDVDSLRAYAPFRQLLSGLSEGQLVPLREGERDFEWETLVQPLSQSQPAPQ